MTWLFFWLADEPVDLTPRIAAEFAYQIQQQSEPPLVPVEGKPDPNCPECRGTGKIKTGDGISWTRCDCTLRTSQTDAPGRQVQGGSHVTQTRSH